jgi:hypothetical protein
MTGFGLIGVCLKPLRPVEQRVARAWFKKATMGELAEKRQAHGGKAFLIQGGKA